MQGLPLFIPTQNKVEYLQSLLQVGFGVLDIGSFVSPRAIPQLSDTPSYLYQLLPYKKDTRFLVIVGNERGALEAAAHPAVDVLGYPWSVSETFLQKNLHTDLPRSRQLIQRMKNICDEHGKKLRVYISMAFGNPYGDPWNADILMEAVNELINSGLTEIALSDTIARSRPEDIHKVFTDLNRNNANLQCSFHLHTEAEHWYPRIDSAWQAGCRQFDSVLNGLGGCPMTGHSLIGNLNTMHLLSYCEQHGISHGLDMERIAEAAGLAIRVMSSGEPLPPTGS
jgi:hydroxymethylglutaryl-CoA lyase